VIDERLPPPRRRPRPHFREPPPRELVRVIAGPDERHAGCRLLFVLIFEADVEIVVDGHVRWEDWRLMDDVGTYYRAGHFSSNDDEHSARFTPPPPADARVLDVGFARADFRVAL
jgi:hypothetical protein